MADATGGNVSVRFGTERIIATPNGPSKAFLQAGDLVELDLPGRPAPHLISKAAHTPRNLPEYSSFNLYRAGFPSG